MKNEFVIVSSELGDWEGLYKNGKLVVEGHHVTQEDIFVAVGADFKFEEAKEEWLSSLDHLPANLSDVEFVDAVL